MLWARALHQLPYRLLYSTATPLSPANSTHKHTHSLYLETSLKTILWVHFICIKKFLFEGFKIFALRNKFLFFFQRFLLHPQTTLQFSCPPPNFFCPPKTNVFNWIKIMINIGSVNNDSFIWRNQLANQPTCKFKFGDFYFKGQKLYLNISHFSNFFWSID